MIHAHKKSAVNGTGEVNQALAVTRPVRQEPGSTRWDPTLNIDQRADLSKVFAARTGPGDGVNGIQRGLKSDVGTLRVRRASQRGQRGGTTASTLGLLLLPARRGGGVGMQGCTR